MFAPMNQPVAVAGARYAPSLRGAGYAPARWRPPTATPVRMGQDRGALAAAGAVPLLISTAMGVGLAWVGFSTGSREKGLLSILGYIFGVVGGLGAATSALGALLWIGGVSLLPEKPTTTVPEIPTA